MSKYGYNREQRSFPARFQVQNGKFTRYTGRDTEPETLDVLQGKLVEIKLRKVDAESHSTMFCDAIFEVSDGDRFAISTIASSSITADIIGRLANVKDYKHVLVIFTWMNGQYSNIAMREKENWDSSDGEKIPFTKFPPVKRVKVGFNEQMDSTERDQEVSRLIDEINGKLKAAGILVQDNQPAGSGPAPAPDCGDMPEGDGYVPSNDIY